MITFSKRDNRHGRGIRRQKRRVEITFAAARRADTAPPAPTAPRRLTVIQPGSTALQNCAVFHRVLVASRSL